MVAWLALIAFLTPVKFGTPVISQSVLVPPTNALEWCLFSWPNPILIILAVLGLGGMFLDRHRPVMRSVGLALLPLAFLLTQAMALSHSINWQVSADTLGFFALCVLVFYAAAWYVREEQ